MQNVGLGNRLYNLMTSVKNELFEQGELAQLSYSAFEMAAERINSTENEKITLFIPIGYNPDYTPMNAKKEFNRIELIARYRQLALRDLPRNGIVQLSAIVEAMFSDVIREIISIYPKKIGKKSQMSLQIIFESKSIDDIHLRAADAVLHDLSYKSPKEFAELAHSFLSINLLECPAFHKFIEIKATRDVLIHNKAIANETYLRKSESHGRAKVGQKLPVDIGYFLQSYEFCLQLTEWLQEQLHQIWHSSDLEARKAQQKPKNDESAGLGIGLLSNNPGG